MKLLTASKQAAPPPSPRTPSPDSISMDPKLAAKLPSSSAVEHDNDGNALYDDDSVDSNVPITDLVVEKTLDERISKVITRSQPKSIYSSIPILPKKERVLYDDSKKPSAKDKNTKSPFRNRTAWYFTQGYVKRERVLDPNGRPASGE